MKRFDRICLRIVRWSSWPLLLLTAAFFATGYAITGQYGMGTLMNERTAVALHRTLHPPMVALLLAHVVPSVYLALRRWGWIGKGRLKPPATGA